MVYVFYPFLKDFVYLFLERGGREKERERNINVRLPLTCPLMGTWPTTQACALTGNRTSDPLIFRLALNSLKHTSQARTLFIIDRYTHPPDPLYTLCIKCEIEPDVSKLLDQSLKK